MCLQVYSECCKNCLLSREAIVSPKRRKEILEECKNEQKYFICHKSSMEGKEIVCKSFYDNFPHYSKSIRVAKALQIIEFVPQPDSTKLPSFKEME